MTANYVLLEKVTLTAATNTLTFDNIPQTGYTDLIIKVSARKTTTGGTNLQMRFNGSTTGYTQRTAIGAGSGTPASYSDGSEIGFMYVTPSDYTAGTFASTEITVPNFTGSASKSVSIDNVQENFATLSGQVITNATWANSASITSVYFQVANGAGAFATGSTFALYGVAALGTEPVSMPKATGGDIVINDGTYWYHTFLSTGTFTATETLSCDILQIGSGGGGGSNRGGGGGAGGVRAFTSQSLVAGSYVAAVGAGGSGGGGTSGNASQFHNLTVSPGGGRGGNSQGAGLTGASGGGGGNELQSNPTPAGGGATLGNVGGTCDPGNKLTTGGGGGGFGGAGGNGSGSTGGSGGAGTNTYSAWATATLTGVSGFYAGGGGGYGSGSTGAGGSGGGGIGGAGNANNGSSGTFATGSGGGATNDSGIPYNGGSGIVIVRYAV